MTTCPAKPQIMLYKKTRKESFSLFISTENYIYAYVDQEAFLKEQYFLFSSLRARNVDLEGLSEEDVCSPVPLLQKNTLSELRFIQS